MENYLYRYKAFVTKVYDGDTITVEIDLGLKTFVKEEKIRLHRINAPEVRGEEREAGIESRNFLSNMILDKHIVLETIKDKKGKYGRYLGEVFLEIDDEYINMNDLLVQKGLAKYQEY